MKYRFVSADFRLSGYRLLTVIIPIVFFGVLKSSPLVYGQTNSWSLSADLGTSFQRTKNDADVKSGLLLPTYAISVIYIKGISQDISLKASLGYRNRGGVAKVSAEVDPKTGHTLGKYQVHSRDHFITNDISLRVNPRDFQFSGFTTYFDLGLRNDLYALTNSSVKSNSDYFKAETRGLDWYRDRHHKPYLAGVTAGAGLQKEKWSIGLEYYYQLTGSFDIPTTVQSNYGQIYSQSIQLNLGYRL